MYNISPPPPPQVSYQGSKRYARQTGSLTVNPDRRDRHRSPWATPAAILSILLNADRAHVPTIMAACRASRNTIHQGISRLRRDGFCIDTIPPPSGPFLCQFYRLIPDQKAKAILYLTRTYVGAEPATFHVSAIGADHDNR